MTANPMGWPEELVTVTERFITCEFATLNKQGTPITFPLTPFPGEDGRTIDVSTGLAYPAKAERARRNPKVGILYSEPLGSGLHKPPVVLVYGLATVRDSDLQAGADRYIRLGMAKFPEAYKGQPKFLLKRQQWYFTRLWIYVTPVRVLWWPDGRVEDAPQVWTAPEGTTAPASDPAPAGRASSPWTQQSADWRDIAAYALQAFGPPVLTVVDRAAGGYPAPVRSKGVTLTDDGFDVELPAGIPFRVEGTACLTFHAHGDVFVSQENRAFLGEARPTESGAHFKVERPLGDFSLGRNKLATALTFLRSNVKLTPYLKRELKRRGQPMPKVNLPK